MMNDAWFYRIKAAQRDLVKIAGGIERVVEITSTSKSHVGRWNNPADPDLMPLNAVMMLEAETGQPLVTSVMASVNGRRLSDPDGGGGEDHALIARFGSAARQAGELISTGMRAMADGRVTDAEKAEIDREAGKLERDLSKLRMSVAGGLGEGGTDTRIRIVAGED